MIIGHVRGQELKLDRTTIATDSIKYLEAEFHFAGRDWDGYVKTAYFINGASKFALVLADDRITADMGLNLTAGEWEVKLSGVKYLCTRDTGIAVYQPLADLVGVYVEEVTE